MLRLGRRFGFFSLLQRMHDETADRNEDAGIGYVERGPGMRERHVQIEEREVDDVAVKEPISEVAHDPGE